MRERYLRSVRNLLDCPSNEKERLLQRLNSAVAAYLEDVPDASEPDLITVFGTPEDCAVRLLEECTSSAVTAERKKRDLHHHVLTAVLAVLLTIMTGIAVYLWSNGGLYIIQINDEWPDPFREMPSDHSVYEYND